MSWSMWMPNFTNDFKISLYLRIMNFNQVNSLQRVKVDYKGTKIEGSAFVWKC